MDPTPESNPTPLESLISQPAKQPALFELPPAILSERLEAKGEYTGERLYSQKPDTYKAVVTMLAQGHGSQKIQDELGVSKNTVKAVRRREGETIDLLRSRLAEAHFDFAEQAQEAASQVLAEIMASPVRRGLMTARDVQSLVVSSGIAVTNGQLLTGKPTVTVGVDVFVHPTEDLNAELAAHIAQLKSANPTHLVEGKNPQKGAGPEPGRDGDRPGRLAIDQGVIELEPTAPERDQQSPAQPT